MGRLMSCPLRRRALAYRRRYALPWAEGSPTLSGARVQTSEPHGRAPARVPGRAAGTQRIQAPRGREQGEPYGQERNARSLDDQLTGTGAPPLPGGSPAYRIAL